MWWPSDRRRFEVLHTALEEGMGADALAATMREGEGMSLERAMDLARAS